MQLKHLSETANYMTIKDRVHFGKMLQVLATLSRIELTDEMIHLYFVALQDLNLQQIRQACLAVIKGTKPFFPTAGELRAKLQPETKEDAAIIADAIFSALRLYGSDSVGTERAKNKIGDIGWAWIKSIGGWATFVTSVIDEEQVPTLKAQCRLSLLSLFSKQNYYKDISPDQTPLKSLADYNVVLNRL